MLLQGIEDRALAEKVKAMRQKLYQVDPLSWMIERFGEPEKTFLWSKFPGYEKHQWDATPDPFLQALNAISEGRDVGIEAATGVGKTYIAARIAYWFLDVFPASAVITTAPTREQLLQVLWKEIGIAYNIFKRIRPTALLLTGDLRINKNIHYDDNSNQILYSNRMVGKVGRKRAGEDSAVAFQGIHNKHQLFILDEAAGLEMSVINAIKNTNTDKSEGAINAILALGNPDSQLDALHQFCENESTEHIIVSAHDHPNIVSRAGIAGAVSPESIKIRADEFGEDSFFYKSRVRGQAPTEGSDSLIKMEWIKKCTVSDDIFWGEKKKLSELESITSKNAVGIDVANSIDGDKAAMAWGKSNILQELYEFHCPNASHLAYNVLLEDYQLRKKGYQVFNLPKLSDYNIKPWNIGVDVVGVGASTINTFHDNQVKAIGLQGGQLDDAIKLDKEGKPLYQFSSLRAQMYFVLAMDLRDCEIIFNIDKTILKRLARELTIIKYSIRGGRIKVEDKEEIKKRLGGKSPNLADCVAYWNWCRKNYYVPTRNLPFK
jgi:hypothetical protein